MSDPLCTAGSRAHAAEPGSDPTAKIEQLLLLGLDHYFARRYELAINIWTRALFIDAAHARARAYIERARGAIAERQRESEELLHSGVAAYHRGESDEARRLLHAAIDGGAPADEALIVLERLNRLEAAAVPVSTIAAVVAPRGGPTPAPSAASRPARRMVTLVATGIVALAGVAVWTDRVDWGPLRGAADRATGITMPATAFATAASEAMVSASKRGEITLGRARALSAGGHLRDALTTLDGLRATDPQKAEGDRLRADIQRQLRALPPLRAASTLGGVKRERRLP